ncbi:MAG: peptide/nickel transport system ATP-binding protein ddpF [Mycobacterium sp.]|nr:peptide/nickel transport system ATP-binding protein ddpF [Mycobacterium sp.]
MQCLIGAVVLEQGLETLCGREVFKGERALAARSARHAWPSCSTRCGCPKTPPRYPHELSGGQRQRASLALSPDLLVADEPTSALDVSVQASVLDLFEELQREWAFACLFISHDLAVVDRLADDVAVLRNGVLQEMGPRDQILRNPQTEYTQRLVAAVPVPDPEEQRRRREASAGLFD